MLDYQAIANGIGATLRAAEAEAQNEGATSTAVHLSSLHEQLGQAFTAANELGAGLEWDPIAGNPSGDDANRSGGTGKDKPK